MAETPNFMNFAEAPSDAVTSWKNARLNSRRASLLIAIGISFQQARLRVFRIRPRDYFRPPSEVAGARLACTAFERPLGICFAREVRTAI